MGGGNLSAVTAEIGEAHVVDQNDEDIGAVGSGGVGGGDEEQEDEENKPAHGEVPRNARGEDV